ncbi:MAG: AmmeMemoRadiSam system radical SAM enzyme [Desulfuromonas sp.]|nr:MAG: AmmeMemoRadiSam system radical SAM enzyme [Desulfuromonas sp.]
MSEAHEAMFWKPLADNRVECDLCRFHCRIASGQRGVCGVRENREGQLVTLVYGLCVADGADPIEKKPLYHVLPGSRSYSIATVGCNFRCLHCQNHQIAQWPKQGREPIGSYLSPEDVIQRALASDSRSIAYTYTEPTIFFEYAYDTARLAKEAGLLNLFVTNGYTTTQALTAIAPYLDAANVDLKGFNSKFYREVTGAELSEVLETLRDYRRLGIWIEVTTLLIPGHNDDEGELRELAAFIASDLGPQTPWHVTGFYPTYRMQDVSPTPLRTLQRARQIGLEAGLHYVYTGNRPDDEGMQTYCSGCGMPVIRRQGFELLGHSLSNGVCRECGVAVAGLGVDQIGPA